MNKYSILVLKILKKIYSKYFAKKYIINEDIINTPNTASYLIYDALISAKPCMIARFGSTELTCLLNYLGVNSFSKHYISYIKGNTPPWWWEEKIIQQMQNWSGFFPASVEKIQLFCELMLNDINQIDILGSWLKDEIYFEKYLNHPIKVDLELLNPYFSDLSWTRALEGKKVLVIHPFDQTIQSQYKKRDLLFNNNFLPEFELITIKAVQSIAGNSTSFTDWFDALQFMKDEIDSIEFDICLIGCGAYGLPLAAHVKRIGKIAFHLGGSLQLLFGIRGKRWENANYNSLYNYAALINEHWVKPSISDKPSNANIVEDACYW